MNDIRKVSSQLMKSPKELASWNFPLSQILEEYFNLLPEPCKIHYGEAALVIQNSVNAYVRRVEELYDETRFLSQKIIVELKGNDEKHFRKEQISKKCLIDFTQFELVDMDKEIGRNINLKNYERKSMKLIHRCFSQLENPHERLYIEVFDKQGEVIGKKYDYRCNQQITKTGILVEEFAPKDFKNINTIEYDMYSSSIILEKSDKINNKTQLFSSKRRDNFKPKDNEYDLNFYSESIKNFGLFPIRNSGCLSYNELQYSKNSLNRLEHIKSLNKNVYIHDSISNNLSSSESRDDFINLNETIPSSKQFMNNGCKINNFIDENQSKYNEMKKNLPNTKFRIFQRENIVDINKQVTKNNYKRKNIENIIDSHNIQNVKSELRRSKRFKQVTDIKCNKNLLKPIPFKDGIPEKLVKGRKEFRLPCHINLLKRISKRKVIKTKGKLFEACKESVFKSIKQGESIIKSMKMTLYSPSRCQFITTKEGNYEKLVKNKIKMIYEELNLETDEDENVNRWHKEIKPRLIEAESKPPFFIQEYESRIIRRLESCDRKLKFDEIVREEPPCEVARYFSAALQLASTNNLNINTDQDFNKSIELILID